MSTQFDKLLEKEPSNVIQSLDVRLFSHTRPSTYLLTVTFFLFDYLFQRKNAITSRKLSFGDMQSAGSTSIPSLATNM